MRKVEVMEMKKLATYSLAPQTWMRSHNLEQEYLGKFIIVTSTFAAPVHHGEGCF